MFAVEVEDINGESHIFEEGAILDMLGKGAIVVEKKMIRLLIIDAECTLYKLLHRIDNVSIFHQLDKIKTYRTGCNCFSSKKGLACKDHTARSD
jgi:hypothetical protein